MKRSDKTVAEIVKELKKRLNRAEFRMREAMEEHGDESKGFLWAKSEFECLERILWFVDPGWDLKER
jgi:hypothetical protein